MALGHGGPPCPRPACRCGLRHKAAHGFGQPAGPERFGRARFTRIEGATAQRVEAPVGKDHVEFWPASVQSVGELKAAAPGAQVDVRHRGQRSGSACLRARLGLRTGRRAVSLVVMGHQTRGFAGRGAASSLLQWQARLRAVECLDLAFLVRCRPLPASTAIWCFGRRRNCAFQAGGGSSEQLNGVRRTADVQGFRQYGSVKPLSRMSDGRFQAACLPLPGT